MTAARRDHPILRVLDTAYDAVNGLVEPGVALLTGGLRRHPNLLLLLQRPHDAGHLGLR